MAQNGLSRAALARIKRADPNLLPVLKRKVGSYLAKGTAGQLGWKAFGRHKGKTIERLLVARLNASSGSPRNDLQLRADFELLADPHWQTDNQLSRLLDLVSQAD